MYLIRILNIGLCRPLYPTLDTAFLFPLPMPILYNLGLIYKSVLGRKSFVLGKMIPQKFVLCYINFSQFSWCILRVANHPSSCDR